MKINKEKVIKGLRKAWFWFRAIIAAPLLVVGCASLVVWYFVTWRKDDATESPITKVFRENM